MKKLLFLLAIGFYSCTAIKFQDPQPVAAPAIMEFPEMMQGTYTSIDNDTLQITPNSFFYYNGKEVNVQGTLELPGDVILKKFKNLYILNLKDDQAWEVITLKVTRKKIIAGFAILDSKTQPLIQYLEKSGRVKMINSEDGKLSHYLISPSNEDFAKLLKEKLFSEELVLKRIK